MEPTATTRKRHEVLRDSLRLHSRISRVILQFTSLVTSHLCDFRTIFRSSHDRYTPFYLTVFAIFSILHLPVSKDVKTSHLHVSLKSATIVRQRSVAGIRMGNTDFSRDRNIIESRVNRSPIFTRKRMTNHATSCICFAKTRDAYRASVAREDVFCNPHAAPTSFSSVPPRSNKIRRQGDLALH